MRSKKNKLLTKKYEMFSDRELLRELKDSCGKYARIYKSIPIANEIIRECGLPRCYYKSDLKEKSRHDKLYKIATERGLNIPQEWYEGEISAKDVLKRIEVAYYEYLHSIAKRANVYVDDMHEMNNSYQLARKKAGNFHIN